MNDLLTKDSFLREFSDRSGFNLQDSLIAVNSIIEIFEDAMKDHSEIHLSGLGTLTHTVIPARKGSKPTPHKKGETEKVEYPEAVRSNFKLATSLRELSKGE